MYRKPYCPADKNPQQTPNATITALFNRWCVMYDYYNCCVFVVETPPFSAASLHFLIRSSRSLRCGGKTIKYSVWNVRFFFSSFNSQSAPCGTIWANVFGVYRARTSRGGRLSRDRTLRSREIRLLSCFQSTGRIDGDVRWDWLTRKKILISPSKT